MRHSAAVALVAVLTSVCLIGAGTASADPPSTDSAGKATQSTSIEATRCPSSGPTSCVLRPHGARAAVSPRAVVSPAAVSAPAACRIDDYDYVPDPDRVTSCSDTDWELFTHTVDSAGVTHVTGSLDVRSQQWASYSKTSIVWTHVVRIEVGNGVGTLQNGTTALIRPSCLTNANAHCQVVSSSSDWSTARSLTPGSTLENTYTEKDTGPAATGTSGTGVTDHSGQGITYQGAGSAGVPPWSFSDEYMVGRCDFYITSGKNISRGCVNDVFIPTLVLRRSAGGASADMVAWAQSHLSAHWGVKGQGQPLHRRVSYDASRKIVCDKTFTPDAAINAALKPYPDIDTCDEFPFAGTYESPGNSPPTISSGKQCAQVKAVQISHPTMTIAAEAADWPRITPTVSPSGSELCVRGHIPGRLNSSVGGSYGLFVQPGGARLTNHDPFWISVVS